MDGINICIGRDSIVLGLAAAGTVWLLRKVAENNPREAADIRQRVERMVLDVVRRVLKRPGDKPEA